MSKIKIFGRGSQVKIAVRRRRPRVIRTEDVIDFLRYTSPAEFCYVIYIALKAKKTVRIVEVEQEKARRTRIREQLGGGVYDANFRR